MADDVQISVSLKLDQLNEGVESAKSSLETLKRGFESLGSIVGISLTVEGIKSFVESMAQLGQQAETIEAQLGITSSQFVQLSGLARLSGIEVGTLALGMERMTLNIQRSTRDGTNPAAQALKQLGLNAQEFTKLDTTAQFEKLTQAVTRFNPGLNLTNALMLIGGRSAGQLVSTLRSAGLGWDEFNTRVKSASEGLAEAIPGMAETHANISILELSVQSLGARIFTALKPAIDLVITSITKWAQSLTDDKIEAGLKSIGDTALQVVRVVGAMVIKVIQLIRDLKAELSSVDWGKVAEASGAGAAVGTVVPGAGFVAGAAVGAGIGLLSQFGTAAKQVEQNARAADEMLKGLDNTLADLKNKMPALSGDVDTFSSRFRQILPFGEQVNEFNKDMKEFQKTLANFKMPKDFGAINFDAAKNMADNIKKADDQYKMAEQLAKASVDSFRMTETQKTEFLKAQLAIRTAAEITAGKNASVAHAEEAKEVARLEAEETKKITDSWKSMADSIASGFSTALDSVLTKQETFAQAMTKMFAKMVEEMIANLIKLMVQYTLLSAVAGTALAPKMQAPDFGTLATGVSPLLGGLLGGAGGGAQAANTAQLTTMTTALGIQTAATTATTAATTGQTLATGVQTAATSTQTTTGLLPILAQIIAQTAAIIANTTALFINTAKSFFPLAGGAWEVGKTYGFPSYASGTAGVPGTQLALLHAGEMVIPAGPASQIRSGGAVGGASFGGTTTTNNVTGGNVSLNISAIDSRSIANMFLNNKNVMQQVLTQIARVNPGAFTRFGTNGSF